MFIKIILYEKGYYENVLKRKLRSQVREEIGNREELQESKSKRLL